jgi:hypothetical protein
VLTEDAVDEATVCRNREFGTERIKLLAKLVRNETKQADRHLTVPAFPHTKQSQVIQWFRDAESVMRAKGYWRLVANPIKDLGVRTNKTAAGDPLQVAADTTINEDAVTLLSVSQSAYTALIKAFEDSGMRAALQASVDEGNVHQLWQQVNARFYKQRTVERHAALSSFFAMKQEQNETVARWEERVQQAFSEFTDISQCYRPTEGQAVSVFLFGLRAELAQWLGSQVQTMLEKELPLYETLPIVLSAEMHTQQHTQQYNRPRSARPVLAAHTQASQEKHHSKDKSHIECFTCKKRGHYASECTVKSVGPTHRTYNQLSQLQQREGIVKPRGGYQKHSQHRANRVHTERQQQIEPGAQDQL